MIQSKDAFRVLHLDGEMGQNRIVEVKEWCKTHGIRTANHVNGTKG
jgi:hypothetical protein